MLERTYHPSASVRPPAPRAQGYMACATKMPPMDTHARIACRGCCHVLILKQNSRGPCCGSQLRLEFMSLAIIQMLQRSKPTRKRTSDKNWIHLTDLIELYLYIYIYICPWPEECKDPICNADHECRNVTSRIFGPVRQSSPGLHTSTVSTAFKSTPVTCS